MLAATLDVLRELGHALADLVLALPRHLLALAARRRRLAEFRSLRRDAAPDFAGGDAGDAHPGGEPPRLRRLMLSCGDASGEGHALRVLRALRARHPELRVEGFGGARLRDEGMDVWLPLADWNVMGFRDVAARLPTFVRAVHRFARRLREDPPDAVLLVDYPGLNRHLLRLAHRRGVPVVDFIAPQLWAWAPWRVRDFRRADRLLTILPFEKDWYARRGAQARFVGHPLADALDPAAAGEDPAPQLDAGREWIALLPGSRRREVRDNLPLLLEAARRLRERRPEAAFVLPHVRASLWPLLDEQLAGAPVTVVRAPGAYHGVLARSAAALVVSGTATLEVAAHALPAVVVYRTPSRLGAWCARHALAVPWIAGANLVAGRALYPEHAGRAPDPERIAADLADALRPSRRDATMRELRALGDGALRPGAAQRVARALESVLAGPARPDAGDGPVAGSPGAEPLQAARVGPRESRKA